VSLVEDLAARLHASRATLPLREVTRALDRLRAGTELLVRVRAAAQPVGVPQLGSATEHLEHAGRALRVAEEAIDRYLVVLGVGAAVRPVAGSATDGPVEVCEDDRRALDFAARRPAPHWWVVRVAALTVDGGPEDCDVVDEIDAESAADPASGPVELLERVTRLTRGGADKRAALAGELVAVAPPVGLALSGVAPRLARRLSTELLGHPPGPADLASLSGTLREPVAAMLPGLPEGVVDTLLARICRVPAGQAARGGSAGAAHPADSPVAGAVLVGTLLLRLGRDLDRRTDLAAAAAPEAGRA
jgi:hypothetical protein